METDDSTSHDGSSSAHDSTSRPSNEAATPAAKAASIKSSGVSVTRAKMNYACEACRLAKVKCQPGPAESGICKRCSEFKRECVFRTGPRTRRSKYSQAASTTPLPPPPGPSKTFSINFDMPAEEKPDSEFDLLREIHERSMSNLYDSDDDLPQDGFDGTQGPLAAPQQQTASSAATFSFNDMSTKPKRAATRSPAGSSLQEDGGLPTSTTATPPAAKVQSVGSLAIKPQFNLESATNLLECFRGMLVQCPVFVLPAEANVRSMAREYPFVLLAILAVTSCTTSLQGYSLYDEEFRKVLGLKFVAGGERSLELLQGLLIYCAWYPFHLRPKNKHGIQYLRMAVDIVRDLELDQEEGMQIPAEDKLASIRAFLGCTYLDSISSTAWFKPPAYGASPWLTKCCNILEQSSDIYQDHILVWLARLQQVNNEVFTQFCFRHKWTTQDNYQRELMRLGLVSRLRELQSTIPAQYSTATSIVICSLFSDIYVVAGIIMRAPRPSFKPGTDQPIASQELLNATHTIRTFLDFIVGMTSQELSTLSAGDLSRIILVFAVAFRVSFPMPKVCPGLDYLRAREILNFDHYLEKLSIDPDERGIGKDCPAPSKKGQNTSSTKSKTDVATALRVVIASLRKTYALRIATSDAAVAARRAASVRSCPMIDGSLDDYIATWGGGQDQQYHSRYYQVPRPQQQYSHQFQGGALSGDFFGFEPATTTMTTPTTSSSLSSGYATSHSNHSSMIGGVSVAGPTSDTSGSSAVLANANPCGGSAVLSSATSLQQEQEQGQQPQEQQQHQQQQQQAKGTAPGPVVFHDLWDAMTIGWTDNNMVDVVGVLDQSLEPQLQQQQ